MKNNDDDCFRKNVDIIILSHREEEADGGSVASKNNERRRIISPTDPSRATISLLFAVVVDTVVDCAPRFAPPVVELPSIPIRGSPPTAHLFVVAGDEETSSSSSRR